MILRFDAQYRDQSGLAIAHALCGEDAIRRSNVLQTKGIAIESKRSFGSMDGIASHLIRDGRFRNEIIICQRDPCADRAVKLSIGVLRAAG